MRWPRHLHLAHEASAEETIQLPGTRASSRSTPTRGAISASSSGAHASTRTGRCTTRLRVGGAQGLQGQEYCKLPTLGDDMTDEGEEGEDVDEGNGDSD